MTNREKIINYLKDNGIDIQRASYIEEKNKWKKPGTVVIYDYYLTREESLKLLELDKRRFDKTCPIEIHGIRYHFEWQYGLKRIFLKKEA